MNSDLQDVLKQNRDTIKALLSEVDADYEYPQDPQEKAEMGAFFGNSKDHVEDAQMTEAERTAWLFEENAKALAAAADAVGAESSKTHHVGSDGLESVGSLLNG